MNQNWEFLENLDLKINIVRFETLGHEWNTDNFQHSSWIIPYVRLYLPVEGEGIIVHHGRRYILRPGKVFLIPAFTPVHMSCKRCLVKYWAHFNAHVFKSTIDLFSVFSTEYSITLENCRLYKELFGRLCEVYQNKSKCNATNAFETKCILGKMLVPFLEKMNTVQSSSLLIIYEILNYIETRIEHPITLKRLAKVVNLNPTYLSNMFAGKMRIPLIRYCTKRRISHAISLFKNNKLSLKEIAQRSGFDNPETFTKIFKHHTGLTPSIYRKKIISYHPCPG